VTTLITNLLTDKPRGIRMHYIVRLEIDDDGEKIENQVWHLVSPLIADGNATFCTGEYFGFGEGRADGTMKGVNRGGITCKSCLSTIKYLKALKI